MQQYTRGRPLALITIAALKDREVLDHWESHLQLLKQAGLISVWSEHHLAPGTNRTQAFQQQLAAADLILLLLSADFFDSSDCLAMMEQAFECSQKSTARIIPLLLRPVAWQESPLAELAPWPSNRIPITQWENQDAAWDVCVQELRSLLGRRISLARSSERSQKHVDRDWERMLRRLRRSYKELLDQSLASFAISHVGIIDALFFGLFLWMSYEAAILLIGGFSHEIADQEKRIKPNQGIRRSFRNSVVLGILGFSVGGLVFGFFFSLIFTLTNGPTSGLIAGIISGTTTAEIIGLREGGYACLQHMVLRFLLWRRKYVPWDYARFLDEAVECTFLHKVGGGYSFKHDIFLDYFASLYSDR